MPPSWVMNRMYLDALVRAGAAPILLPLLADQPEVMRELYERLDGLLLPGGVDIEPSTFGEERHALLRHTDPPRDIVELQLARWALDDGMPVLGLCRGLQILNIAAGGTLFQDVQAQRYGSQKHDFEPPEHNRDFLAHEVELVPGSRLHALVGAGRRAGQQHASPGHPAPGRRARGHGARARWADRGDRGCGQRLCAWRCSGIRSRWSRMMTSPGPCSGNSWRQPG